jgi:glycosyltransferase involved in cell wall biosynthesis
MICFGVSGKGTYWRALHLARGLAGRGHTVTVMSTARHQRQQVTTTSDSQPGVTLVEMPDRLGGPFRAGWDPLNVLARLRWGRDRHFDLVHAFESRPAAIYPALAWQRRGAQLVMDWCDWFGRGGSVEERPNPALRTILRPAETYFEEHFRTRAAGTTVINSTLRQKAIDLGVKPESIFFLPNGSDLETFQPQARDEARRQLGWPLDWAVVGYVGAMFQRDAVLMARAFEALRQRVPQAGLLLAGYCNVAVEKLVAAPEAVIRTGPLDFAAINRYLAACDVCWLPLADSGANRGRFPLKVNDYMAVGKPVVATAVGDVADLIVRGEFGLICRPEPNDLADKVSELLREPDRAAELGRNGRTLAEREFRWGQIADRLAEFYRRIE